MISCLDQHRFPVWYRRPAVADNIVTRLRYIAQDMLCDCWICQTAHDAADEIERLHAEINELRLQVVTLSIPTTPPDYTQTNPDHSTPPA